MLKIAYTIMFHGVRGRFLLIMGELMSPWGPGSEVNSTSNIALVSHLTLLISFTFNSDRDNLVVSLVWASLSNLKLGL